MSIVMRIYIGMGAMIALTIVVGGFAAFQTNSLANTFVEYRATSKTNLIAGDIMEDLFEARLASSKYRLTKDEKYIAELSDNIVEVLEFSPELFELMVEYPERAEVQSISEMLEEYESLMVRASELQQDRNRLTGLTATTGLEARQKLSEVMETALSDGDPQASSVAGIAANNLLLGRLYLERFLVSNKSSDAERATQEIESARSGLVRLMDELQNPRRRELTQSVLGDLDTFDSAKKEVVEIILSRNAAYDRMDEIGPEALDAMEKAVDAVIARQNTLGPAGVALAQRSILIVLAFVMVGTLVGGLLAFFTGRIISRLLTKVTEDMTELADGNLEVEIVPSNDKHEVGQMTNAMVVFLESARKARDLDAEVKQKEEIERKRETAENGREAELEKERREVQERERQAEKERMKTLEDFQQDMERVLGEAASGDFSNRMSDSLDDASLAGLANVINQLLQVTETNIDDVVSSIGELAKGNLGIRIEGDRKGAFLRMKDDFNEALVTLSQTMAMIMNSGHSVSSTSSELEVSALDMAKRAENNAAAVEETSSAVEQITASIRQVVENAKAADDATRRVRESANRTREVSDETEASINAMTDASAQINRVVKVIEDRAMPESW